MLDLQHSRWQYAPIYAQLVGIEEEEEEEQENEHEKESI